MLRVAPLAALLLVTSVVSGAVDPHPRQNPSLTLDGAVTAFAMASNPVTGNAASILAGRADPDGASGETPRLWRAWNADGGEVRGRTADKANCVATAIVDQCLGNVVALAVADDGVRIAVAARDDSDDGRLILSVNNGDVTTFELANEQPSAVAMSADGTRIALGSRVPGSPETGRVRSYTWSGTGSGGAPASSSWHADTDFPVTDVAIGADGRIAASAGDRHYRFAAGGTAYEDDVVPTVNDVAFSTTGNGHWSVAGTSDGFLYLYSDEDDNANPVPYDQPAGSASQTAVAIARDATLFAGGDADGVVRLYRNAELVQGTYGIGQTPALPGRVSSLQFSADGKYLVAAAGPATVLLRTGQSGITEVWRSVGTVTVLAAGLSHDGGMVASASGNAVTVFTTVFGSAVTPPAATAIEPGTSRVIPIVVKNTGNREATVALSPTRPADWTATLSASSVTLAADAEVTVNLNVTAPAQAAPGAVAISVTHTVQGQGSPVVTAIPVSVSSVRRWTVETEGAVSRGVPSGGSVQFPLTVRNLGNGADSTEVTATVDRVGWSAEVAPASLSLPAGAQQEATLTIFAPEGLATGEAARATVRLGADATAVLQVTATLGARFGVVLEAVPADSQGVPGRLGTFVLRVTNTGNAPDRITVTAGPAPTGWAVHVSADALAAPLAPGAAVELAVQVTPAAAAAPANYEMPFLASSAGDPSKTGTAKHTVRIDPASESATQTKKKDSPPVAFGLGLVALAALAAAARRKD